MTTQKIPALTISLLLVLVGFHFLMPDRSVLYFSITDIQHGQFWRLITGHFVHADLQHLAWNGLGLALLGAMIEQHSRLSWWAALLAGICSVNVLLLSSFASLDYYCGLSGVLNTFLLMVLWLEWRLTRAWLVIVVAIACLLKVIVEIYLGESVVTHISWPPYAWSHAAGLSGGLVLVWLQMKYGLLLHSGHE